jgi:cytochrome c oxidase subunit II
MINLLIAVVTILAVITLVYVVRILELTSGISGKDQTRVSESDNKTNGILLLLFMVFGLVLLIYMTRQYMLLALPVAASEHGVVIDRLFNINWIILGIVFFGTQILLFFFAFKYRHNKDKRSYFYPDNHKLEFVWTVIPTIVIGIIIYLGLRTWNEITSPAPENSMIVEVYGKQFMWNVRYPGPDAKLGQADYNLISGDNPVGIISLNSVNDKIREMQDEISATENTIARLYADEKIRKKELETRRINMINHLSRLYDLRDNVKYGEFELYGEDDILTNELRLPVNQPVVLKFRSQDVIHSAYMPHFRVQMNTVPGMTTEFAFTPTITTAEMREIQNNPEFNYVLLCNKICGVAHFSMKMNVVIEEEADFNSWLQRQQGGRTAPAATPRDTIPGGNASLPVMQKKQIAQQ